MCLSPCLVWFRQKLEAKLAVLKLHLSDEKIQMIADFFKHIPMPHSNSMMGLDDSVDGHVEPHLYTMVLVGRRFPHNIIPHFLITSYILYSVLCNVACTCCF